METVEKNSEVSLKKKTIRNPKKRSSNFQSNGTEEKKEDEKIRKIDFIDLVSDDDDENSRKSNANSIFSASPSSSQKRSGK